MVISLNCLGRAEADDLQSVLPALAEVAERVDVPQSRLGVVLDWVQYRRSFRDPVVVRRFLSNGASPYAQVALDMRRARELDREALVGAIVGRLTSGNGDRLFLEDWVAPSKSVMWAFNRSYWRHLSAWDTTFEKDYSAALPGGVSDGTNPAFWRERIEAFVHTLHGLDEWSELPDEIHVLELGVGNGAQARVWLDTFKAVCDARGLDYPDRLRYVMADYSPDVLAAARRMVAPYRDNVTHLDVDFRRPLAALADLRGRVLFAHACNVHDNLPTDEVMRVGGRGYEPLVRAYLDCARVTEICTAHGIDPGDAVATIQRVLRFGPAALGDEREGVRFWSAVWDALALEEVYAEIPDPSAMRVAPSVDLDLGEVLARLPEWTRVHLSSVAVESLAQTLELLHPEGVLQLQDLFVRDLGEYSSFRGPGKIEGSIVNWLNGPLFQMVGERLGFHVGLEPFTYRAGSNIVVLTARRRDASSDERLLASDEELLSATAAL
jgi:SAM-dependent methyltransferase